MNNVFALDLKDARIGAGLTQQDCAHLLGVATSRISKLENGQLTPSLREICAVSLLFGRSFESLFNDIFDEVKAHMSASFESLPESPEVMNYNNDRQASLNRLYERLQDFDLTEYDI